MAWEEAGSGRILRQSFSLDGYLAECRSRIIQADLLQIPWGRITEAGLRRNIDVALRHVESWLRGIGCVPIYNLMQDAATAEICRAQLWQ